MGNPRFPKRVMTQKRSAWQVGEPGGIVWLLKWLALLALVVLLILAVIPSDKALADPLHHPGSVVPAATCAFSAMH